MSQKLQIKVYVLYNEETNMYLDDADYPTSKPYNAVWWRSAEDAEKAKSKYNVDDKYMVKTLKITYELS